MKANRIKENRTFAIAIHLILVTTSLLCLFPLVHVLAVSFSSGSAVAAGKVTAWPVDFTLTAYRYALERVEFWRSLVVTLERIGIGWGVSMVMTILIAYPLSKDSNEFRYRTFYVWIFFFTTLFSGGLIPFYMVIRNLHMLDTIWALVLPAAVPVFNILILLNFFRQLPREVSESAQMDGASHMTILWKVYVPMSTAALATLTLFVLVTHWNSWFDGLILMNKPEHYPLQSYLQTVVLQKDISLLVKNTSDLNELAKMSDRTLKSSQIFLGALPIMITYPFLQKYFVKGIVLGSVKG
ncbi:carbohydrate ABC transporter permease [Cohnella endophytica]|uniref:Carbohydrate ABC transporter permease n=1 Tax=Cohnella endophytica TaxID=2419778 RepID=A0A494XGG5_9BACL|nr:carbohydrate ABC transporter permease [Cohnella endophytica]RKP48932.1 carbohydrate ABC transporter permease [Cohnella endophytica]